MSAPVTYNHYEFTPVSPKCVVIHFFDHGHPSVCSGFDLLSLMTNDVLLCSHRPLYIEMKVFWNPLFMLNWTVYFSFIELCALYVVDTRPSFDVLLFPVYWQSSVSKFCLILSSIFNEGQSLKIRFLRVLYCYKLNMLLINDQLVALYWHCFLWLW